MTTKWGHLSKAETITIAAIEQGVPTLVEARELVDRFQAMIRQKAEIDLEPWIIEAKRASWYRSRPESPTTRRPCTSPLRSHGPMVRWKLRLQSSSSSNAKCTGARISISFRPDLSPHLNLQNNHRTCVRAKVGSRLTFNGGGNRSMRPNSGMRNRANYMRARLDHFPRPSFDADMYVVLDRLGRFLFLLERWSPCLATELC